ncbi:hypothetical protein BS47DRAFT_1354671 [Hydnum rufescens UP504]|uniref:G domain-containing protein n=1 Tax=Hydnum rufescens UP504 TaxID=1448309 RepID=A0A9P6AFF3_9AGAM|nr:hypothetical protein BS47DRAFT_1354671 [Hydnum rufescens UP504]
MLKSIRKHLKLPKKFTKKESPMKRSPTKKSPTKESPAKNRVRNKRFRILILGPANAGKTTLLERLTDSPAGAAIVRRNGKRGYDQRGIHNIDDEITYASNSDFVFHDSGGGRVEELQAVWKFIRSARLCIPTDNDRPFGFLQSGFFSTSTASVPVIGIFTKLDGRETKVRSTFSTLLPAHPIPCSCRGSEQKVAEICSRTRDTNFRR